MSDVVFLCGIMEPMKTNIKATHIELTEALEEYLAKRLSSLDKFISPSDESSFAQIEVAKITEHHKTGDVFRAEINLHAAGVDFYSFAEESDIYRAIDAMKEQIVYKLSSAKDKRVSLVKRGGRRIKNFFRNFSRRKDRE